MVFIYLLFLQRIQHPLNIIHKELNVKNKTKKRKAQTYRFVILLSLVALTTTGVCWVCCWYCCCLAGEQTTDFCFEACLYRLSAKNNASTAFKLWPEQMSLLVIESKPPTFDKRNTFRHEFTLSYWNIKIGKVSKVLLVGWV